MDAHGWKVGAEKWCQRVPDLPAEGRCYGFGGFEGHPVAWIAMLVVAGCHLGEGVPCAASAPPVILWQISRRPGFAFNIFAGVVCSVVSSVDVHQSRTAYLGVLIATEEMCRPHEADVVIPHDSPFLFLAGDLECILEDCIISIRTSANGQMSKNSPSKLPRPVRSWNVFLSLL